MRRVKFFTVCGIEGDYDTSQTTYILKKEVSDWLEVEATDLPYLWNELSKTYKVNYPDRLVMVEDLQLTQQECNITIELAKKAIKEARKKEEPRKEKAKLKKEQKKAQSIAEKKKTASRPPDGRPCFSSVIFLKRSRPASPTA